MAQRSDQLMKKRQSYNLIDVFIFVAIVLGLFWMGFLYGTAKLVEVLVFTLPIKIISTTFKKIGSLISR